MDVVRLGLPFTSDYQPDALIEGYSSMIWTERQQDFGEFQLNTPKILETLQLLPPFTLISHMDTDDVHMVEDYELVEDDLGRPSLKVTGRSLTSYCDHRWVEGPYQKKRKMARDASWSGAALVLLWQAFVNGTGHDVTREGDFDWPTKDVIPNVVITDSVANDGTPKRKWLTEGSLWPQLQAMLIKADLGLRVIRPSSASNGQVVTIDAMPLDDRGKITRTQQSNISQLRFDLYSGLDRRESQTVNPKVVFSRIQGHVNNSKFLDSVKDYKTALEVMAGISVPDHYRAGTGEAAYTGLKRRVFGYDAGSPDLPDEPKKPKDLKSNATAAEKKAHAKAVDDWIDDHDKWEVKVANIKADFLSDIEDDLQAQLKSRKKVSLFDGDISPLAPYQYKRDYNLGDRVTLYGDKGEVEDMIVTEYIRTEDSNGDRGYPTLTAPDASS